MLVGVPKEIKDHEHRVGLIPATARGLVTRGHHVIVETGAGVGAGLSDDEYSAAGAEIVPNATIVFERAEMIVKVKEPLAPERKRLRRGQILFTYRILPPIGSRRLTSSPRASPPSLMQAIETLCRRADLVIGAVLVPGGNAPKLISAVTFKR
jgi:alanine dehydrogenase